MSRPSFTVNNTKKPSRVANVGANHIVIPGLTDVEKFVVDAAHAVTDSVHRDAADFDLKNDRGAITADTPSEQERVVLTPVIVGEEATQKIDEQEPGSDEVEAAADPGTRTEVQTDEAQEQETEGEESSPAQQSTGGIPRRGRPRKPTTETTV